MDSTTRFSDRVADYIKYRPGYPDTVFDTLVAECGLTPQSVVADLGSGTGILTDGLLTRAAAVFAIEPNQVMREAAEALLGAHPGFHSVNGAAEATSLADRSVDLVTAGQAFHWFDVAKTRTECVRILRPRGFAVLLWNDRKVDTTPFLQAYETLLIERGTDYTSVDHKNVSPGQLAAFFGCAEYQERAFPNEQRFDWEGLYGRAMSSSYVPGEGAPGHAEFARGLRAVFDAHHDAGFVTVRYQTRMFYRRLS